MTSLPPDPAAPPPAVVASPSPPSKLSKRERREMRRQVAVQAIHYEGPLPDPDTLARFDEIHPGAAGIIIGEFQQQGEHRRDLERRVVKANIRHAAFGQWFAFAVLAGTVAGGVFLVHEGRDLGGFGVVATAVVGGLWALRTAAKAKQQDLSAKREGRAR